MRLGVTVVICTYNGAALLAETLRHIARQQVQKGLAWEVLLVDNASTDETARVAADEWEKHNSPTRLSILHQPKQGLTYARELSLRKANYEFVLFCDDDNWLHPGYVNRAYELMVQHPEIGVLGGNGELVFESPPPQWALGHGFFANGPQAPSSGSVSRKFVYGAGFVIRKSAYETLIKAGFSPLLTDRIGGKLSSGGDYELCYAIALAGYDIWFDNSLTFKHFMPACRFDWNYFVRFISEGAKSFEVIVPYRIRVSMGSKTAVSFHLKFTRIALSYVAKMLPLLVERLALPAGSERAKTNTLKLISLKTKILTFRRYRSMKENFSKILKFEQENLAPFREKKSIKTSNPPIGRNKSKATLFSTVWKM